MPEDKELFFPHHFSLGKKIEDDFAGVMKDCADQLNLMYQCAQRNKNKTEAELLISLAIKLQLQPMADQFLNPFYNLKKDNDGIWINKKRFFSYLESILNVNEACK